MMNHVANTKYEIRLKSHEKYKIRLKSHEKYKI